MGCFDTITFACPACKDVQAIQSKAGSCSLAVYDLENAPLEILAELANREIHCETCGALLKLELKVRLETCRMTIAAPR